MRLQQNPNGWRYSIRRRDLVVMLGGAAVAWPFAARAQEAGRIYRVGGLGETPRQAPIFIAFFDELRQLGLVEGQQFTIDARGWGVPTGQFPKFAAELVEAKVDLILGQGEAAIRAAQQATSTIPILGGSEDMIGSGLVHSLSRPEGNTTGFSLLSAALDGKRQEILLELVPGVHRIAALADSNNTTQTKRDAIESAARVRGVEVSFHLAGTQAEIGPAIDAAHASGAAALNVLATPFFFANRRVIFERTASLRLPAMYQWPEMAEDGGLVAYGPRLDQIFRQIFARQFAKVLRGAKPADIPVEQPTKFELVFNLKTARALGITISREMLLRADEVIE